MSDYAYVFWHWKRPETTAQAYEARQRAFHAALTAAPPDGFAGSFSAAISGAPWAAGGGAAYEDWYLVRDFAALAALNAGAVSGPRSAPHDAAAVVLQDGAGGVYGLRGGTALRQPRYACWFSKPEGMSYPALLAEVAPLVDEAEAALWLRQLVLGPAREFCLHSAAHVTLPPAYSPLVVPLRPIWPAAAPGGAAGADGAGGDGAGGDGAG